jgi:hypothetical protein
MFTSTCGILSNVVEAAEILFYISVITQQACLGFILFISYIAACCKPLKWCMANTVNMIQMPERPPALLLLACTDDSHPETGVGHEGGE